MAINAISTTMRNAMCNALVDGIDVGSSDAAGAFNGYTAAFASLLFECPASNPAFGNANTGVATANAITADSSANNSGTAAVGRVQDRDNATVFDFSIGAGSGDLSLNTVSITSGDSVTISSATVTMPAS